MDECIPRYRKLDNTEMNRPIIIICIPNIATLEGINWDEFLFRIIILRRIYKWFKCKKKYVKIVNNKNNTLGIKSN